MTCDRAARLLTIAAALLTFWLGLKALVLDHNPPLALVAFWAVAWQFAHLLNLDRIKRLHDAVQDHAAALNKMAAYLTEDQRKEFAEQVGATITPITKPGS